MRRLTLVFVTICLALLTSCSSSAQLTSEQQESSRSWLAIVDAVDFEESWSQASMTFQSAVTQQSWVEQVRAARGPLGALEHRTQTRATTQTNPPGAPDGDYIIVIYDSSFENKAEAVETHSLQLEEAGVWRTAGHFIR